MRLIVICIIPTDIDITQIELMLRSGEQEGQPQICQHQTPGQY